MIRVVMADDDRPTREGFRLLLERAQDIQIVGEARDGREAVDITERVQPDVVLMDVKMPRLDGLRASEQIHVRMGSPKILFVTSSWDQPMVVRQAMDKGGQGVVAKPDVYGELIQAIYAATEGKIYFSQKISPSGPSSPSP